MEILTIWLKIIGIIALWEAWKYFAWEAINWWVDRHVKRYEDSKGKCPYLDK